MHECQPAILKRDATGRVHYSREQREALLDEFERSGLKGAAFVRTVGISYPTFANWIQQRRHARGDYRLKGKTAAARSRLPGAPRWIEATTAGGPVPGTPAAAFREPLAEMSWESIPYWPKLKEGTTVLTPDPAPVQFLGVPWRFNGTIPNPISYDVDGNLLTDGRWTYTWDGEPERSGDRLTS